MSTLSRKNVRDRIRTKLADPSSILWTDTELNAYIQNGYDQFCRLADAIWERQAIPDEPNIAVYDLPDGITKLDRVTWDDYRIDSLPTNTFLFQDRLFEQQTGPVTNYMVDGDGFRKIRKIRVPFLAAATKFYVEYYRIGAKLTADTDIFEIPDHYLRAIVFYALGCARARRGKGQDLKRSAAYMAKWQEVVDRAQRRNSQAKRRTLMVVGGGGRNHVLDRPPRPAMPWQFGKEVPR